MIDYDILMHDNVCELELDFRFKKLVKPIIFTDSTFKREINFSQATLRGNVIFTNCTFDESVIFGDGEHNVMGPVLHHNIEFQNCVFKQHAMFDGIRCMGGVCFKSCKFEGKLEINSAIIDTNLYITDCCFCESLSLNSSQVRLQIIIKDFKSAQTLNIIDFTAVSAQAITISGGYFICKQFVGDVKASEYFLITSYELGIEINRQNTEGNKVENIITLLRENDIVVDISDISIIECRYDILYVIHNKVYRVDYHNASKRLCLYCIPYIQCPIVNFSNSDCGKTLQVNGCVNIGDVFDLSFVRSNRIEIINSHIKATELTSLVAAKIDEEVVISSTNFETPHFCCERLNVNCCFFDNDRFDFINNDIKSDYLNFSFCEINNTFQVRDITFTSNNKYIYLNMCCSSVGNKFHLENNFNYDGDVNLFIIDFNGATFNYFVISDIIPSNSPIKFNFNNFRFNHWFDNCEKLNDRCELLAKKQVDIYFTRDIYLQLESYYRRKDQIHIADSIYYSGMRAYYQKNSKNWNAYRRFAYLLWQIMGFGTRSVNILYIILLTILVGAIIILQINECSVWTLHSIGNALLSSLWLFFPFEHDSDLITTASLNAQIFLLAHKLLGYILIPIWIASITGYLKKNK